MISAGIRPVARSSLGASAGSAADVAMGGAAAGGDFGLGGERTISICVDFFKVSSRGSNASEESVDGGGISITSISFSRIASSRRAERAKVFCGAEPEWIVQLVKGLHT